MADLTYVRKEVSKLLAGEGAHIAFDAVVADFPSGLRGTKPDGAPHTAWELLEHLRLAQLEIIEYTLDTKHPSLEFPAGYWPKSAEPPGAKAWTASISAFKKDLQRMQRLVEDSANDPFAALPGGSGETIYSQALLLADHNSYHLGQLVIVKRSLTK